MLSPTYPAMARRALLSHRDGLFYAASPSTPLSMCNKGLPLPCRQGQGEAHLLLDAVRQLLEHVRVLRELLQEPGRHRAQPAQDRQGHVPQRGQAWSGTRSGLASHNVSPVRLDQMPGRHRDARMHAQ